MTTATVVGVPAPVELPDPHALVRAFAGNFGSVSEPNSGTRSIKDT